MALRGVAAIISGILAFIWPGITAIVLLIFIAEIAAAVQLRRLLTSE